MRYPNNLADFVLYRLRHVNPNIVRFLPSLQRVRAACVAVCKVSVPIPATAYLEIYDRSINFTHQKLSQDEPALL